MRASSDAASARIRTPISMNPSEDATAGPGARPLGSEAIDPHTDRLKLGLDRLEVPLGPTPDVQPRRALAVEHAGGPALPAEGPQLIDPPDERPARQGLLQRLGSHVRHARVLI